MIKIKPTKKPESIFKDRDYLGTPKGSKNYKKEGFNYGHKSKALHKAKGKPESWAKYSGYKSGKVDKDFKV